MVGLKGRDSKVKVKIADSELESDHGGIEREQFWNHIFKRTVELESDHGGIESRF